MTGSPRFLYAADERAAISASAPRGLKEDDWQYFETIAADFLSRYPRRVLTKTRAMDLEKRAKKLGSEVKALSPVTYADGFCLWSPEISAWMKALNELQDYAKSQQQPKSLRKKSNNSRDDVVDGYLTLLVLRFMEFGEYPGTGPFWSLCKFCECCRRSGIGYDAFPGRPECDLRLDPLPCVAFSRKHRCAASTAWST
jgi:hypothetical protein